MVIKIIMTALFALLAVWLIYIQFNNYKKRVSAEVIMEEKLNINNIYFSQYEKLYSDNRSLKTIKHDLAKHKAVTSSSDYDSDVNSIINIIVSEKKREAIKKHIVFESYICKFEPSITEPDMVGLLTNLLDNAIEACERTKKQNSTIQLIIDNSNINIINDKLFTDKTTDNNFISTKGNKTEHGFGMNIIRELVGKYGGIIDMVDEGECFKTMIHF